MTDNKDPSANVLLLVGNATSYLEKLIRINREVLTDLVKLQVEVSQRERLVESNRVNANRADDRRAVELAAEKASKQAEVLANQLLENAENVRVIMEKTANVIASQLKDLTEQLTKRLTALENAQFEKQGVSGLSMKLQILIATTLGGVITGLIILAFQSIK